MRTLHVSDAVRSVKFDLNLGKWKTGHIPRSAFPLSKAKPKSYKFGPEYSWRIVEFVTSRCRYKVLILVNENKLIFRATLAAESADGGMVVLCQHEYHQSEPGWHCHVTFKPMDAVPSGAMRSHLQRWPKYRAAVQTKIPSITVISALSLAAERFRFSAQGDLI